MRYYVFGLATSNLSCLQNVSGFCSNRHPGWNRPSSYRDSCHHRALSTSSTLWYHLTWILPWHSHPIYHLFQSKKTKTGFSIIRAKIIFVSMVFIPQNTYKYFPSILSNKSLILTVGPVFWVHCHRYQAGNHQFRLFSSDQLCRYREAFHPMWPCILKIVINMFQSLNKTHRKLLSHAEKSQLQKTNNNHLSIVRFKLTNLNIWHLLNQLFDSFHREPVDSQTVPTPKNISIRLSLSQQWQSSLCSIYQWTNP